MDSLVSTRRASILRIEQLCWARKGRGVKGKRRIDVMLSSTFIDLEQHRNAVIAAMNGLQLSPLAQEFDASSDSDLIKSSLEKVDTADVYVGLIGARYGQRPECRDRNPECLSLTELEYRHAGKRKLPRLMFIMGDDHPLTLADLKRSQDEGEESRRLQAAFIARVRKDLIAAEFSSPADLQAKANTSFVALQRSMDCAERGADTSPAQIAPPSPDDSVPASPPIFHYVRKPYVEKQGFAGRAKELALIDEWATGTDAMLLFQAIGGMGKSMLIWHWLRTRAAPVRSDWAGLLWYSFYEQGADLNDFCVHALAYLRHAPPKTFRGRRTLDLGDELRRELDARPFLLILDGLERVLVAYNRAGKEHMSDDEAAVARDDMGLDREPHDCFRPEDDDVLAMLAQASQGKLLASSRLTPTALTNAARQPIPGVMRVSLEGLAPEDAERVLRNNGVRGDSWRMKHFLDDQFRCHPLSVGIVAGLVMTFLDARGDFDHWVESPRGGADPALVTNDLRGRQNHILARAFDGVDNDTKALLGSIAMASIELTPDVLSILNPMRPIEPQKIDLPRERNDADAERFDDHEHWSLKLERDGAKTAEAKAAAQEKLNAYRQRDFASQTDRYNAYVAAYPRWQQKVVEADAWLTESLPDLEARGLLQYDAQTGLLDMHPAIRHTVLIGLSPEARSHTGSHVSDALSSRLIKPFDEARKRDDLTVPMTRVEALNVAGKLREGWGIFKSLVHPLFRLNYFHEQLELLQPYFPQGWEKGPLSLPEDLQTEALETAALALNQIGKPKSSCTLYVKAIARQLREETLTASILGNLSISIEADNQSARAERLESLALHLAEVDDGEDDVLWLRSLKAGRHVNSGQLGEAEAILVILRKAAKEGKISPLREADILALDLELQSQAGSLSEHVAEDHLKRIRMLGQRFVERISLYTIATWHQSHGKHGAALDVFGDLVALANEVGSPRLPLYEVRRALSLAVLGRQEEAMRIARKVDRGEDPPHMSLASLYLELGDPNKTRAHAIAGYREAWGEGPPYHDHWGLERCRKVLAALGEPEPVLLPFDPSKIEPFDFERDVERLIEKKAAEKTRKAEEDIKRKAAREATLAKSANNPERS
jgi:hypothetical protein